MTTVVYRDGVLASDSLISTSRTACGALKKLYRLPDGSILGLAGTCDQAQALLRHLAGGGEAGLEMTDVEAIRVMPDGSRLWYCASIEPLPLEGQYFALGTGTEAALGALHCGASAVRAVEAAIAVDLRSGGEIQVMTTADG